MLEVNSASPMPVYEQLIVGILREIETGELAPGDRLPTVRLLAADLGAAPGTVARAYSHLEMKGVLATRGRRGTFVVGPPPPRDVLADEAAEAYLAVLVDELGYSLSESIKLLAQTAELRKSR